MAGVHIKILVVMLLLVRILHWVPAMAGLGMTLALIPVSAVVGERLGKLRRVIMLHSDARIRLVSEVLAGEPCLLKKRYKRVTSYLQILVVVPHMDHPVEQTRAGLHICAYVCMWL